MAGKRVADLAYSLLTAALKAARERRGPAVGDLSSRLATVSWTSRLLMKSMMLCNELVMIPKGGLTGYIENLVSSKILQRYTVMYVSGNSENGSFRLLFVNGGLKGVYAVVDGKEHVGDEKALNMVEGTTRVKVYASLGKPEEVLAG